MQYQSRVLRANSGTRCLWRETPALLCRTRTRRSQRKGWVAHSKLRSQVQRASSETLCLRPGILAQLNRTRNRPGLQ